MAKDLLILPNQSYALARLQSQLELVDEKIRTFEANLVNKERLKEIATDIPKLWSSARCALAESYLLPISYMKMTMDWSNEFKCLGHYGGYAVGVSVSKVYQQYIKADKTDVANRKLFQIFADARKVKHNFVFFPS